MLFHVSRPVFAAVAVLLAFVMSAHAAGVQQRYVRPGCLHLFGLFYFEASALALRAGGHFHSCHDASD